MSDAALLGIGSKVRLGDGLAGLSDSDVLTAPSCAVWGESDTGPSLSDSLLSPWSFISESVGATWSMLLSSWYFSEAIPPGFGWCPTTSKKIRSCSDYTNAIRNCKK